MYFLDLIGTLAFAISGAYKAKSRELNIFGVAFLGLMTAIGGGTVRDLIIGRTPLFYLKDPAYLIVSLLGTILAYYGPNFFKKRFSLFRFLDSVGLATFAIIGTSIAYNFLYNELSVISFLACTFLGALTGVGGGILRDAVLGDTPFAFKHGSNYITAAYLGSVIFLIIMSINIFIAGTVSMIITLYFREVSSKFGLYHKKINNNK